MELPFNRIVLDKTLSLAPNPRKVKNYWQCNSKAENLLVESLLIQFKTSAYCQRLNRRTYTPIFSSILANLLNAHYQKTQVIYSRDTQGDNKQWIKAWDFLVELRLVHTVIAPKREAEVQSWSSPLPELINLLNKYKARIVFDANKPSIEVRDKDKNVLPIPERKQTRLKYNKLEQATKEHNEVWLSHSATLDNAYLVPFSVRKFNNSLEHGGRFYNDIQRLPSKERAKIKIDSIATVELDYKSQHLAILYAWEGLELKGDPYLVEGYERDTIKAITLRAVNIESLSSLKSAITLSANPINKIKYKAYKQTRLIHDLRRAKGLKSEAPPKPKWVKSFIENIPSETNAENLLRAFSERHSAIYKHIGSECIGVRLQAIDSEIMALVLDTLTADNTPALPIHDSILIRQTDKAKARLVMQTAFKEVTGQHCIIDQK
jgi:hypothetical protein